MGPLRRGGHHRLHPGDGALLRPPAPPGGGADRGRRQGMSRGLALAAADGGAASAAPAFLSWTGECDSPIRGAALAPGRAALLLFRDLDGTLLDRLFFDV